MHVQLHLSACGKRLTIWQAALIAGCTSQVDRPPDIDARNAYGVTIRELAATAAGHASRYDDSSLLRAAILAWDIGLARVQCEGESGLLSYTEKNGHLDGGAASEALLQDRR